jgi:transposase
MHVVYVDMFIRIAKQKRKHKTYRHLQIAESYRDPEKGNSPRTRILAHLGTVEGLGEEQIEKLIAGLQRAIGKTTDSPPQLLFARDYGHVHAVGGVWDKLGLSPVLEDAGIRGEASFDAATLIRLLVVNRICDPCSKLALLDWLESVCYDKDKEAPPSYHHLLRAMDRLLSVKQAAEPAIARQLIAGSEKIDLVFYDITSTYFEGDRSLIDDDFRRYGYSRDGRFDKRQIVIGLVMTRSGIPLCHHIFPGNTVDKTTVVEVIRDIKARFHLDRVVFVGDRGMLSDENLDTLLGEGLGFIVAYPLRRNAFASEVIGALDKKFDRRNPAEQFHEDVRAGMRFVVAYSPEIAAEVKSARDQRLEKADAWIKGVRHRLAHPSGKGRKPTPQGTYDRIRDYLRDHHLLGLYSVELTSGKLSVTKNKQARAWEETIDGMLMLGTTDMENPLEEIVKRYKELAEIERGWRSLKSTLLLRPVYHWTEKRIRAHVFICVLALQLERWMRRKLEGVSSVPRAMRILKRVKIGELEMGTKKTRILTRPSAEQKQLLKKLGVVPLPNSLPAKDL